MPNDVGRRCVLKRSSDRPSACSSPRARAQRGATALRVVPFLAPEARLGDAAGDEQQRASELAEGGTRSAARLRLRFGNRDFGRRQDAAYAAGGAPAAAGSADT